MKTRKTWAIPIAALAFAMLFAYGLIATGTGTAQAQGTASNAAPTVVTGDAGEITPATHPLVIDADGDSTTATIAQAFSDTDDAAGARVYTALSNNHKVAKISMANDTTATITNWWNALDGVADEGTPTANDLNCDARATALGFEIDATNAPRVGGTAASGLCQAFDDIGAGNRTLVRNAFFWNMLSGAQMTKAATLGDLTGDYAKPWGQLTTAERTSVEGLYTAGILAKGLGPLTIAHDGIDNTPPDGEAGTTSIEVNVSDSTGRFIANYVGTSFDFTSVYTDAPDIVALDNTMFTRADGTTDTGITQIVAIPPSAGVEAVPAGVQIRINTTTDNLAKVTATVAGLTHFHQKLYFSLDDGANLPFAAEKIDGTATAPIYNQAMIVKKSGAVLNPRDTFEFTLSVSEVGREDRNYQEIKVRMIVAVEPTAPSFADDVPATGTVAERARDFEIATFSATDPNNQVLTYSIVAKPAAAGLTGAAATAAADAVTAAEAILTGLDFDATTGVLKTKDTVETDPDQPDYVEDNPETAAVDESEGKNSHVFVITASDGALEAMHEFTLTVTDEVDPEPGAEQKLEMAEDNEGGLDNYIGNAPTLGVTTGAYAIGQQIDNRAGITTDEDDVLFAIEAATGKVYLKADKRDQIDFESGITSYTLSVLRVGATLPGFVVVTVTDVNEAPEFSAADDRLFAGRATDADGIQLYVLESAAVDETVKIGKDAGGNPSSRDAQFAASDEDSVGTGNAIVYSLWYDADTTDADDARDEPYTGDVALVKVDSSGKILVNQELDTDADDSVAKVLLDLRAADPNDTDALDLRDTLTIEVNIIDTNVAPEFDDASKAQTTASLNEDIAVGTVVYTYFATDADGDTVRYLLRDQEDAVLFELGESDGVLKTKAALDFETKQSHTLEVQAHDTDDDKDEVILVITVVNVNDNAPVLEGPRSLQVAENSPRGTVLGTYAATDADGDAVTFSLKGANAKSFQIGATDGILKTLESLDFDSANTPCPVTGCLIEVVATDAPGLTNSPAHTVAITIVNAPDSISTLDVSKANPVPGASQGDPASALADVKATAANQTLVLERPADLPATGDGTQTTPDKFVGTEWANWGTVLRIAVTSQSPDANCDGGNRCVVVVVEGDSSDDILQLRAYRSSVQENLYVAAVMPVSGEAGMVETVVGKNSTGVENPPIYKHTDGSVARLKVDEEDKIKIEFGNLRGSIDVENEVPEIDNFLPEHEAATDDGDVDYTFTVTDDISGMPDVEDLPNDSDDEYIAVVALVSNSQCHTRTARGFAAVPNLNLGDGLTIYCPGTPTIREIIDDNDFDDIDGGFEVETTVVLGEGKHFVTFIACDNAGNCSAYDPEQTKEDETLPEITVDTVDPELIQARTGVKWNSTDNEYDDDRTFVQVLFREQTALNPDTIEADDFVVEGHTIKKVFWYDPDDEDRPWADGKASTTPTRFGQDSKYQTLEYTVFLELEDELAPDETPDVALVPNGIEDKAGNEQDDGEEEAEDWIAPNFAIVSIVSPREAPESAVLAGEDDEVVITVTVDERIKATRPDIAVNYVNASSVATKGTETCDDGTTSGGTRKRGEIITPSGDCLDAGEATGGQLSVKIEKVSNTEWTATIDEPDNTGYFNIYVSATDRSSQQNPGDEGVAPAKIVTDFFKGNGDVDSDDAIYFEGDIVLNDPTVRVSGTDVIDDSEPTVELKTPLFIEFDFSTTEGAEYAEDSFDFVQITKFTLDGVDMTDSVRTTDDETFLVALSGISAAEHEIKVQAVDRAGNTLDDELDIDFEVEERDPFDKRLDPGWNLVSLPGEPADSSIATVFGSNVDVKTVYTYDPVVPGGWLVAVRETLESDWQGDLTEITAKRGYWVLSDAIQDWKVSIPRLAGGAVDSGTPIQPPVIPMYAGWNLVPVIDVTGDKLDDSDTINAQVYLNSLDDGLDLARVLGFNTITNQWRTLPVGENASDVSANLNIGSAYWVFVRESASLVPGGN